MLESLSPATWEINVVVGAWKAAQPVTAASAWIVSRGAQETTGVSMEITGHYGTTATILRTEYQKCCAPHQALVQNGALDHVRMAIKVGNNKIINA